MQRFTIPRDIYYGRDALSHLKELKGKRAFLVLGGGSMRRLGFLDQTMSYLKQAGMEVRLFENVEPDPSVETVLAGGRAMAEFSPDWIISVGGGSAIDAAKAMWVFYEYPDTSFESLVVPFSFPTLRTKARFCAIPSTSGTATEVTAFSVITDNQKGIKYPLADYEITPDVAILDPALACTMPPQLTAHTGMDALTHAMEAYVSTAHTPFTDPLALKAITMIFDHLPASYEGDAYAREQMHYAQCLAGMAFTNALLGIVHSLAHKTGAAFTTGHIPHGCANAMYLPYVIQYNAKSAGERYGQIARALGMEGKDDQLLSIGLAQKVTDMNGRFGIPLCLREAGVREEEFAAKQKTIAGHAFEDACTASNPRPVTRTELEELLLCIYTGKEVNF